MQVLIVESAAAVKAVLRGRVSEGLRQADIRGLEVAEAPEAALQAQAWGTICGVLIGPSAHASIDQTVERVRKLFPQGPLGVVLTEEPYQKDALAITKRLNVRVYRMAELTGLATCLIEVGNQLDELGARVAGHGHAHGREFGPHGGVVQDLDHLGVEPVQHGRGRTGRRDKPEPGRGLKALDARFGQRWHFWQQSGTALAGDGESLELAGLDQRQQIGRAHV